MEIAFWLLMIIGHLGFFDMMYYHTYKCRLHDHPECRPEVITHTCRHIIYALQFFMIAHLRFYGWALLLLLLVYIIDAIIAWTDVWLEKDSREKLGGLHKGEYLMHIILSVLVGAYLCSIANTVHLDFSKHSTIAIQPPNVPAFFRFYMTAMGCGALFFFLYDGWKLIHSRVQQEI